MAMEVVAGAIGNMLPMLGEPHMEEYNPHKPIKKYVEFLRKELETMHAALVTAGEVPQHELDKQVKNLK